MLAFSAQLDERIREPREDLRLTTYARAGSTRLPSPTGSAGACWTTHWALGVSAGTLS